MPFSSYASDSLSDRLYSKTDLRRPWVCADFRSSILFLAVRLGSYDVLPEGIKLAVPAAAGRIGILAICEKWGISEGRRVGMDHEGAVGTARKAIRGQGYSIWDIQESP